MTPADTDRSGAPARPTVPDSPLALSGTLADDAFSELQASGGEFGLDCTELVRSLVDKVRRAHGLPPPSGHDSWSRDACVDAAASFLFGIDRDDDVQRAAARRATIYAKCGTPGQPRKYLEVPLDRVFFALRKGRGWGFLLVTDKTLEFMVPNPTRKKIVMAAVRGSRDLGSAPLTFAAKQAFKRTCAHMDEPWPTPLPSLTSARWNRTPDRERAL